MVIFLFLRGGRGVGRFSCVSRFWTRRRERRRRGVPARGSGARAGGGALCEATTRAGAAARRFQGAFSEERARVNGAAAKLPWNRARCPRFSRWMGLRVRRVLCGCRDGALRRTRLTFVFTGGGQRTLREELVGLAAEETSTPLADVIGGPTDAVRTQTRRVRAAQSSMLPAR